MVRVSLKHQTKFSERNKYWLHKLLPAEKQKPNEMYILRLYEHIISIWQLGCFSISLRKISVIIVWSKENKLMLTQKTLTPLSQNRVILFFQIKITHISLCSPYYVARVIDDSIAFSVLMFPEYHKGQG